jgi:drug/metabolite transporter (DMT)-like permease
MTIERLTARIGACLGLGGLALVVAAVVCLASIGDGGPPVHSIHMVGGWILATIGAVMIASGIAIASAIPAPTRPGKTSSA